MYVVLVGYMLVFISPHYNANLVKLTHYDANLIKL
jgi:hypothetical protein